MKIEDQACSLELAKHLNELGVLQKSLFYWHNIDAYPSIIYGNLTERSGDKPTSAFLANELIDLLPKYISTKENEPFNNFLFRLDIRTIYINDKFTRTYTINYYCDSTEAEGENAWLARTLFNHPIYDENLSNALAKALIYLMDKQFIANITIINGSMNIIE